MRRHLSTAEALLDLIASAFAIKRLPALVMLILFVPAESFADKKVVDSRYIELTGIYYSMWKLGALPPTPLCASVGNLTMKTPPYDDVAHCFCADMNRFSEQAGARALFLAQGDSDGDPIVCPWVNVSVASPPQATNGSNPEIESENTTESGPESGPSGSGPVAAGDSPQDSEALGACQSPSANSCNQTTAKECAARTDKAQGAPWQWCGASAICVNKQTDKFPFELHVCQ